MKTLKSSATPRGRNHFGRTAVPRLLAVGLVGGATTLTALGCSQRDAMQAEASEAGSLDLALTVGGTYTIAAVEMTVRGEDAANAAVVRERVINVSDPNATVSAREAGLPAGAYGVALEATLVDNPSTPVDESEAQCDGSVSGVLVAAGQTTNADLVLTCTLDGGQVILGGGIRVHAEAQVEVETCTDLYTEAFVGSLGASVGSSVALSLTPVAGATVSWSATRGTVAADGSSYTCPATPGKYTVTAQLSNADGCADSFSETVTCHSAYEGDVGVLPSAFAWEGCALRSPCHLLSQNGNEWTASCRGQLISGEATSATSFPFFYSRGSVQLDCVAELSNGELVGSCEGNGEFCSLNSNQSPSPDAKCEHLLDLPSVTTCGDAEADCDAIQQGCTYQAKCADGTIRTGSVNGQTLVWDVDDRATTGQRYQCSGAIAEGAAAGTCTRRNGDGPESCAFAAEVNVLEFGSCSETLPTGGVLMAGCGFDGALFASQRGCVWEFVSPAGTFSGYASEDNVYTFTRADGSECTASVVDGKLQGTCGSGENNCEFGEAEPTVDESCFQLPDVVATRGCGFGSPTPFNVVQDGCTFYGFAPSRGVFVAGQNTSGGVTFPGISAGWVCTANVNAAGDALAGECKRENADGTVSGCRDLTSSQEANLVLDLTP